MDDPLLDEKLHLEALKGLSRLNHFSNGAGVLWRPIATLFEQLHTTRVSVLDIATGGGDLPIALAQRAAGNGLTLDISGCDFSSRSVAYASHQADRAGVQLSTFPLDILKEEIPGEFDVVMTSLFFHHIDPPDVVVVLEKMARAARHLVLVNDLERSPLNLALVYIATRVLSRSPIIWFDGPVSVRAAYTTSEISDLARQANLSGHSVQSHFPCRLLLQWSPAA